MTDVRALLRAPDKVLLTEDAAGTHPGWTAGKRAARAAVAELGVTLADQQARLWARGRRGDPARVVLLLQAMDTGGKDGCTRKVLDTVNPAGVEVTSFGRPTEEELSHDFLWRVEKAVPGPGVLGVFNRSQYEDVLVVRVHDLVPPDVWGARYDQINAFEAAQSERGVIWVKCFLHVSHDEQRTRLLERLDDPAKHWKVEPADIAERQHWPAYTDAYTAVLERCSTDVAPWYVVPADDKWYRDWAVSSLLVQTLAERDLSWPVRPELDLPGMRAALQA